MMYSKILVSLDGSPFSEGVLPYVRPLARAVKAPVELLYVIDPNRLAPFSPPMQGGEYLERVAESFHGIAAVKRTVELGDPASVIVDLAAAQTGTLVAMTTHGYSGTRRWLLGSVAEKVLNGANNHLLLVRASEAGKTDGAAALKTVVVALDGSPLAEKVLPLVVDLAEKVKLKVVFLRAYALPSSISAEEYGSHQTDLIDHLEWEARDYLEQKIREVKEQGLVDVEPVVKFGYGAQEIIALGRDTPDNFIAMCTHGRSGIGRWVLGSVTQRVVQHSGDPVLIIRAA